MSVWFEESNKIDCFLNEVKQDFKNLGEHYVGIVSLMPGLSSVNLVEQGKDFVTIRTNEGLMKRTNFSIINKQESFIVEFDEEYQAGSKIKTKSHFLDEFTTTSSGINHRTVISDVEAPGLLGFLYRTFGSSNIGNAILESYKTHFEK
jgi:hypothetical protein